MIVPEVEQHNVIDSTKLKTYIGCPRRFFFNYILGWKMDSPDHNLKFGSAVHIALEYLYEQKRKNPEQAGYAEKDIITAWALFMKDYREAFPEDTDSRYSPKDPENFMVMLADYAERYKADAFEILHTEISGSAPIGQRGDGSEKRIFFKLDTVFKDHKGRANILEHKTSAWSTARWITSFRSFKTQVGTGIHVLCCLFEDVGGMTINGLLFRNPPRMKKDGTPYKNAGDGNELIRIPIRVEPITMQSWLSQTNRHFDALDRDMQLLASTLETDDVMQAFPRAESDCFSFNRPCEFMDYCDVWHNPARESCRGCPTGFHVEHWDPREDVKEYTTKVSL